MNPSEEIFVLPGADALEIWRGGGKGTTARLDDAKAKNAGWYALPLRSVISVPMHFPAMAPDRREAAAMLELEGLGLANLAQQDFQVQVRDADLHEQRAWTVVQTSALPAVMLQSGLDGQYAPSVSFHSLRQHEVRLWKESGRLVMAVPDDKSEPLHAQAISAYDADEDAAAEVRCILASLDLAGMSPDVTELIVEEEQTEAPPPESFVAFAEAVGLPVTTKAAQPPHLPAETWRLLPQPIVQRRLQRQQQQTMMLAGAGFALVFMALLGAYAGRLWQRERGLAAETARLKTLEPELQAIRDTQQRWSVLESAVTPDQYAVEIFHQVANLLPEKGIRMEVFDIKDGHIIIAGEASNQALAGALREDLKRVPAFANLQWDFPTPQIEPNGQARFRADGSTPVSDLATNP